ncbi:MAG: four helix bundle protein [Elainellaceae cyanobacterium]
MKNTKFLVSYRELRVYQAALDSALQVFELSHRFPAEEQERLARPLVQATRLVCVYIAQAWLRRRYPSAFVARLNHAEAEAAATQVWLELAVLCHYLDAEIGQEVHHQYWEVLSDLDRLIANAAAWVDPI